MFYPYYKCENHLHLDGSFAPYDAWNLAIREGIDPGYGTYEEYVAHAHVNDNCESLYDYLACFDAPLRLLQTPSMLQGCSYHLGKRLAKEHVLYAEIRYAPQQHIKKAMTQKESVEAVLAGLNQVMQEKHIYLQLILCMMILPQDTSTENAETLRLAKEYLGKGVCAIDLAGAEGVRPMEEFRPLFEEAHYAGIPFTIHAGENGHPSHIKEAIDLGASRIGHGVHIIEDEALLNRCAQQQIPLEICYTSNQQCHVFSSDMIHPVRKLFDAGIPITINTDNRSISNTSLTQEYEKLAMDFNFTVEELRQCNRNVLQYAFLPDRQKEALLQEFDAVQTNQSCTTAT